LQAGKVSVETATLNNHYRAAFTSNVRKVAAARHGVAGFAAGCGFSEEAISDIRLAAGEALSNAVEHGSETPSRKIVVDCTFADGALTIEIQDSGHGFAEPCARSSVEPDDRGRGFGIFLMRRLMDEVTFAQNGTLVRLVRRR
jgi:serine/threonine-protein kinase RsbW